jgi:hypothetical protein
MIYRGMALNFFPRLKVIYLWIAKIFLLNPRHDLDVNITPIILNKTVRPTGRCKGALRSSLKASRLLFLVLHHLSWSTRRGPHHV